MRSLLGVLVVAFTACGGPVGYAPLKGETNLSAIKVLPATPAPLSGVALIENGLAYDGCSYPIAIGELTYAASPATKALVASVIKKIGTTRASITYRRTGGMTTVDCGWGSTQTLPEIEVLTLAPLANSTTAIVRNDLPADGCSYPVEFNHMRYAPSPASKPKVMAFAEQFGANPVVIEYELTNGVAEVECGWGVKEQLPEIEVLSIRAGN